MNELLMYSLWYRKLGTDIRYSLEGLKGWYCVGDPEAAGSIILKLMWDKHFVRVWTGLKWFTMQSNDVYFWTHSELSHFKKAEFLLTLDFQAQVMEWVRNIDGYIISSTIISLLPSRKENEPYEITVLSARLSVCSPLITFEFVDSY
jgi:hypothetical protein